MQGKIVNISGNSSMILTQENSTIKAHIKGNLRKKLTPVVGDNVEFETLDENQVNIIKIFDRKNLIYRPKISNVDQVIVVTSLYRPLFASYILNKYIIFSEIKKIKPVLLFTKIDLLSVEKEYEEVIDKIS